MAWRGYVQESECPKAVADFVGNRFTLFQGANFHILAYLIPGPAGEREPGKRRINWVWWVPAQGLAKLAGCWLDEFEVADWVT